MIKRNSFVLKNANVPRSDVCSRTASSRRAILLGQTLTKERTLISRAKTDSLPKGRAKLVKIIIMLIIMTDASTELISCSGAGCTDTDGIPKP
jgi:hypothetical protein